MAIKQKQIKDTLHNSCIIHNATSNDIQSMVRLSKLKRLDYEKAQPQFWRHAPDAEIQQTTWFNQLLKQDDHFLFVAKANQHLVGFIIGRLRDAPEVYRPGVDGYQYPPLSGAGIQ
jgi:ribosomal protein S18 acetylase RimI-like enzyme